MTISEKDYDKFLDTKNYYWCLQHEAGDLEEGEPISKPNGATLLAQSKRWDYYKAGEYLIKSPINSFANYRRLGLFTNYLRESWSGGMQIGGNTVGTGMVRMYINKAVIRKEMKKEQTK